MLRGFPLFIVTGTPLFRDLFCTRRGSEYTYHIPLQTLTPLQEKGGSGPRKKKGVKDQKFVVVFSTHFYVINLCTAWRCQVQKLAAIDRKCDSRSADYCPCLSSHSRNLPSLLWAVCFFFHLYNWILCGKNVKYKKKQIKC